MSATKRRNIGREKRARRYFSGGVMPDGLEMFALDGGKLEIMQEILDAGSEEELTDDNLGHAMIFLYASRYDEIKGLELEEIVTAGREKGLTITLEDRQAAEEIILADFDALQASVAHDPKTKALVRKEEQVPSLTPDSSGLDSSSDTQEKTSQESPPLKSSKSSLQTHMQTEQKEIALSGHPRAKRKLGTPENALRESEAQTG